MTYAVWPAPSGRRPCGVEGHAPSPGCDVPQPARRVDRCTSARSDRADPPSPGRAGRAAPRRRGRRRVGTRSLPVAAQRRSAGDRGRPVATPVALHVGPATVTEPAVDSPRRRRTRTRGPRRPARRTATANAAAGGRGHARHRGGSAARPGSRSPRRPRRRSRAAGDRSLCRGARPMATLSPPCSSARGRSPWLPSATAAVGAHVVAQVEDGVLDGRAVRPRHGIDPLQRRGDSRRDDHAGHSRTSAGRQARTTADRGPARARTSPQRWPALAVAQRGAARRRASSGRDGGRLPVLPTGQRLVDAGMHGESTARCSAATPRPCGSGRRRAPGPRLTRPTDPRPGLGAVRPSADGGGAGQSATTAVHRVGRCGRSGPEEGVRCSTDRATRHTRPAGRRGQMPRIWWIFSARASVRRRSGSVVKGPRIFSSLPMR